MDNLIPHLRDRLSERTSVNALKAFALTLASSLGASMAAAMPLQNALYIAAGAGLVAAVATLTPEKSP